MLNLSINYLICIRDLLPTSQTNSPTPILKYSVFLGLLSPVFISKHSLPNNDCTSSFLISALSAKHFLTYCSDTKEFN